MKNIRIIYISLLIGLGLLLGCRHIYNAITAPGDHDDSYAVGFYFGFLLACATFECVIWLLRRKLPKLLRSE
jgi:hypothetical protein